ncbi:MAG: hypothetical protein AB1589_08680 [Cyanobacteriota bacterium]
MYYAAPSGLSFYQGYYPALLLWVRSGRAIAPVPTYSQNQLIRAIARVVYMERTLS